MTDVVFICQSMPAESASGAQTYNFGIIRALKALGLKTHVVVLDPWRNRLAYRDPMPIAEFASVEFIDAWKFGSLHIAAKPMAAAKAAARHALKNVAFARTDEDKAVRFGAFPPPSSIRAVAAALKRARPRWTFFDTVFTAAATTAAEASTRILIAHDVFHRRKASFENNKFTVLTQIDAQTEQDLARRFHAIAAISETEKAIFKHLCPEQRVVTLHPAVSPMLGAKSNGAGGDILFIGSKAYHNKDSLAWLLGEIWPEIHRARDDARLHVVGSVGADIAAPPAGVQIHGRLQSLEPLAAQIGLGLNPARMGSGLKVKMVDYFNCGLGCVTTSIGAEGFPQGIVPFAIADSTSDFADAVIHYLQDPCARLDLSKRAVQYAEHFSLETLTRSLAALLAAESSA